MNTTACGGASRAMVVVWLGEGLVTASMITGMAVLIYLSAMPVHPRAWRLIADDWRSFTKHSVPYLIAFSACYLLSPVLKNAIASSGLVAVPNGTKHYYYLASKFVLNVTAFGTKFLLFWTRSNFSRALLFVSNLVLMATIDAMCHVKYERQSIDVPLVLLFTLTTLILIAPEDVYQNLVVIRVFTWKRFTAIYGVAISACGLCHHWLNDVYGALLQVFVIHVQLIVLCVTYFSDGQQILQNIAGRGRYNPMADSLDIYFTIEFIMSKTHEYIHI